MKLKKSILFLIILFLSFLSHEILAAGSIRIPEKVVLNTSWIELGQIADISGVSSEDLERLETINLGKALLPGYTKAIPFEQIKLLIENEGFLFKDLDLEIPDMVYVSTASRVLNKKILVEMAEEFLINNMEYSIDELDIKPRFIPPEIILPDRDYSLDFRLPVGGKKIGNVSLQVSVIIDDMVYRRLFLGFEIKLEREVYLARRPISVGEKINSDDFYLARRGLSTYMGELILSFNNPLLKDGIVNIPIPQDAVLTTHYLTLPTIVRPGDELQAEIIIGSISVTTMVKARQSGKKGDFILVENKNTGHRFKAQVLNAHIVQLVQ